LSTPLPHDRADLRSLHAALALGGSAREAELRLLMPQLKRSGCALVLQAADLAEPPSHTVHMHAAFCSAGASAIAHFCSAFALEPANEESVLAAAYHSSMQQHSQHLIFNVLARLVPAPARTGRQLYALAIAAAVRRDFRSSSHYFALAAGRGVLLRDMGDSWAMALADGGQPVRALQVLLLAGCCDGMGRDAQAAAAEWCRTSAVNVAEILVAHEMAQLALKLLQCATGDGQLQADVASLSCAARAHRALGDVAAAAALFSEALQLQPHSADVRRNMGMIMQEAGLLQQAEHHLSLCVQANADDATAMSALATVFAKTGRLQQAEHMFLAAAKLQPDNDSVRSNVATFYRNNKMWAKAEAFATQVLARDAGACDMYAQLLQIHGQQSQPLPALRASARYAACCSAATSAACADVQSAQLSDIFFRRQLCDWSRWQEDADLLQMAATGSSFRSGSFSAIQASVFLVPPAVIRTYARRQAAELERMRLLVVSAAAAADAAAAPQGPLDVLRVGFSFSDWFDHPVGDDALAAVAAAAAGRQPTSVFCISPSVPLHSQVVNNSHPCLRAPVEALFLAENSTEVSRFAPWDVPVADSAHAGGSKFAAPAALACFAGFQR
jgi:Flp pilus assembly protein TadD